MKIIRIIISLFVFGSVTFGAHAESLYEKLGESPTIYKVMVRTLELSMQDERVASTLARSDLDRLAQLLTDQTCELTGGPCTYDGLDMKKAHIGLGLTTAHFNALVEHLQRAMSEENIPNRTQNQLLALFAPMHRDVVEK